MKLYLIRGLPGTGKSTFAKSLNIMHVEHDMMCINNGEYSWCAEKIEPRDEACRTIVDICLGAGADCVVSDVFIYRNDIDDYRKLAEKHGAELIIYTLRKEFGTIHGVSKTDLIAMRLCWQSCQGEVFLT